MKMPSLIVAAAVVALALPAQAGRYKHAEREVFVDKAKVVNVQPIVEVVRVPTEREECWIEQVSYHDYEIDPGAGTVVGAVLGGVVGYGVTDGRSRGPATAAGTAIGAVVGHTVARSTRRSSYGNEQRCRIVEDYYEEERISGYRVTYRYRGQTFVTETDRDPGPRMRVRVAVVPLGH
jgi:uncharacterized protein YcfJ